MGNYLETKHDTYNLKFKEHEVFKDKLVIVDESDSAFIWIDKETGKVSFSGKYFHLYKEQRLLETLTRFVYLASEYLDGDLEDADLKRRMERNLKKFEELQSDFEVDKTPFYYKVGELVLFYWKNEWRQGKVINGYRTHDGIINVELDNGEKVWCGEARHEEFIKRA